MSKAVQSATHRCQRCGLDCAAVRGATLWEFEWQCVCGNAGVESWAHANPPPLYEPPAFSSSELNADPSQSAAIQQFGKNLADAIEADYARSQTQTPKGPQMFRKDQPLYLRDIQPGVETVDQETRKTLTLDLMAQPFTRSMADDLGIGAELFEMSTGEPNSLIVDAKLRITVPLQRVTFKTAIDSGVEHVFDDVEIDSSIKVRADKEGPILSARLKATLRYPSPDELLFIMSAYTEQLFVTFTSQQQDLLPGLGDAEDAAPPRLTREEQADLREEIVN